MSDTTPPAQRLLLLDAMRGIAAIGVMLYHAHNLFGISGVFGRGYLCVDFFFVLSGFVLTRAAGPRLIDTAAAGAFLRARVRRLWPMVALGVVLGVVQQDIAGAPLPVLMLRAVAALMMVPFSWCAIQIFPLNGPQWSLLMELVANAVHALGLRRIGRRGLIAGTAAMGLALAATIVWHGADTLGPEPGTWPLALPRVLFPYMVGMLLAGQWRPARASFPWWWGPVLLPTVSIGAAVLPGHALGDLVAALVLLPAVFWITVHGRMPTVAQRGLAALGGLSFPLYAIQMPILLMVARIDHRPIVALPAMAGVLVASHVVGKLTARRQPRASAAPIRAGLAPA